ncbi:MAG: hypothetical protein ACRC3Z_04795 [Phocaeicola sp.]
MKPGNAIPINPQAGQVFKEGDFVSGDVIGYIGITDNSNPDNPHLSFDLTPMGGT